MVFMEFMVSLRCLNIHLSIHPVTSSLQCEKAAASDWWLSVFVAGRRNNRRGKKKTKTKVSQTVCQEDGNQPSLQSAESQTQLWELQGLRLHHPSSALEHSFREASQQSQV